MTKLTLASYPHMLGFEQLERVLERTAKGGNEGYPPFKIEQTSDFSYRITLAVKAICRSLLRTVNWSSVVVKQMTARTAYFCTEASPRGNSRGHLFWLMASRSARH